MSEPDETGSNRPSLDGAYNLQTPEDNLRLYSDWADTYDQGFAHRTGYRSPKVIADAYLAAGGGWPLLDAGCGTGLVAEHLPAHATIDGLDLSPEMLETARAKGRYRNLIEADLTGELPLQDAQYLGLVSAGTFTHGHVGPEALHELMRVLKPGAACALSGNAAFFEKANFKATFDALAAAGVISTPEFTKERIYDASGQPPPGHADDIGLVVVFTRL
ncbi:MAG: class I SAM-dependent methyltransferase [Pseudomonadota bacterium]